MTKEKRMSDKEWADMDWEQLQELDAKREQHLEQRHQRYLQWEASLLKEDRMREESRRTEQEAKVGRGVGNLVIFLFNILVMGAFVGAVFF